MSKRKNQNEDYGPPKKKSKVVSTVKIPKTTGTIKLLNLTPQISGT